MKQNNEKTNVMRILDQKKIEYLEHCYVSTSAISGEEVASVLGENPSQVFKTLVTIGNTKNHYVFLVPVNKELDLKKAAKAVNEKSIEMIKSKELLPLTGYIHGGCSPIGMKKQFQTIVDQQATCIDALYISGGERGVQIEMTVDDLIKITKAKVLNVTHQ